MSNFYQRAIESKAKNYAIHLVPTSVSDLPDVKVKDLNGFDNLIDKESSVCQMQARALVQVQPKTTVSGTLLNAGVIDFELSKDQLS